MSKRPGRDIIVVNKMVEEGFPPYYGSARIEENFIPNI